MIVNGTCTLLLPLGLLRDQVVEPAIVFLDLLGLALHRCNVLAEKVDLIHPWPAVRHGKRLRARRREVVVAVAIGGVVIARIRMTISIIAFVCIVLLVLVLVLALAQNNLVRVPLKARIALVLSRTHVDSNLGVR